MTLYKYSRAKWGIAILRELRLKVSPPKAFNDPFEFTPTVINPIESLNQENLSRLNDRLRQEGLAASTVEDLQKVLPVLQNNQLGKDFASKLTAADMSALEESSKHFGVLCLSELRADMRMWAHYGDEHQGVVVGLDFDKEINRIGGVVCFDKVKYDNCRPRLDPMLETGEAYHGQMVRVTMTKSKAWEGECEHRMVFKLDDIQKEQKDQAGAPVFDFFAHIRPETIREVIMGCFISERDAQTVHELCKAKLPWVQLFKLTRHATTFDLVPVPISLC